MASVLLTEKINKCLVGLFLEVGGRGMRGGFVESKFCM